MIIEQANYIETYTIQDAWREVMQLCFDKGYPYIIEKGSFEGQLRIQLPFVTLNIKHPGIRPLAPIIPPGVNFQPTTDDAIETYFANYIMDDNLEENEVYRYSSWIAPQVPFVIEKLNESHGNSNHPTISVGDLSCMKMEHSPCLRLISFKMVYGKLVMTVVFRSWDLVNGMPENLGGLQLLKEYILSHLTFPIEDGSIIAHSDGLHLYYDMYKDVVDPLIIKGAIKNER